MKNYEELTIRDHFMFGKICLNTKNCQIILRALLGKDINIVDSQIEKEIKQYSDSKFVRLDLLAEDDESIVYNGELQHESQNTERQRELPKRARYYQGMIDTAKLSATEHYRNLPETYIIFICTYDPFGIGLAKYTFDTKCNEVELSEYNDFAHKIFFNTTANLESIPLEQRNMLQYIETGDVSDDATKHLESEVRDARLRDEWRAEYMLTVVHDNDIFTEGYDSGYDSGYNSRQNEIDSLTSTIDDKNAEIAKLQETIKLLQNNS